MSGCVTARARGRRAPLIRHTAAKCVQQFDDRHRPNTEQDSITFDALLLASHRHAVRTERRYEDSLDTVAPAFGASHGMAAQQGILPNSAISEAGPMGALATSTRAATSMPARRSECAADSASADVPRITARRTSSASKRSSSAVPP